MDLKTMGERVAWARAQVNVSRNRLESLADLAAPTVYLVETDHRMPGADAVLRIARALGTSVEWLVDGSGDAPTLEEIAVAVARAGRNLGGKAA